MNNKLTNKLLIESSAKKLGASPEAIETLKAYMPRIVNEILSANTETEEKTQVTN